MVYELSHIYGMILRFSNFGENIVKHILCIWIINEVKKEKESNILPTCHTETVMIYFFTNINLPQLFKQQ